MEYRIDRDALAAFVARQVDVVEAGSIPKLLADVVELRLRHESVSREEAGAFHHGVRAVARITSGAGGLKDERRRSMQTIEQRAHRIEDAAAPLWFGSGPAAWGDVVRGIDPEEAQDAASMIAAAGLGWRVEQHPLEAVVEREYQSPRLPVPRHVANVRSDTRTVLGVVGEGTSRFRTRRRSRSATRSPTRAARTGSEPARRAAARACTR